MSKATKSPRKPPGKPGPKVGPEGPAKVLAASVPTALADAVDDKAKRQGISRSQAVTEALRKWVAA